MLFLILVSVVGGNTQADIIIDDFTDETNDRFTNSGSFIGAGFDFSGVGRRSGWSTLVSQNVVITAEHSRGSGQVSFYPSNDPNSTPVVREILAGGQQIGSTDLYLRVLDEPVSSDIKIYDFATESISAPAYDENTNSGLFNAGSFQNEIAYMMGVSSTDHASPRIDQAVGRNVISGYIEDIPFDGKTDNDSLILLRESPGDAAYVQYESRFVTGDSGAPLFVESNGELLLLGVNSFISTTGTELSGVTYIGNHAGEINAFISANAVPEPNVIGLGLLALIGLSTRRRK
ncbi:hypothetical protein [Mariniblastus fucicola]|uniref:hypothetical protein n=1 Tax=Mariniblastus fucicola TaxID=980251 RepID=UPI00143DFB2A|nr:hypothetical protein [Mariniblastus fucicola]